MKITCESCHTRFNLADAHVSPRGVKVRCSRCGHRFRVEPVGEAATDGQPAPRVDVEHNADVGGPGPRSEPDLENPEFLFQGEPATQSGEGHDALPRRREEATGASGGSGAPQPARAGAAADPDAPVATPRDEEPAVLASSPVDPGPDDPESRPGDPRAADAARAAQATSPSTPVETLPATALAPGEAGAVAEDLGGEPLESGAGGGPTLRRGSAGLRFDDDLAEELAGASLHGSEEDDQFERGAVLLGEADESPAGAEVPESSEASPELDAAVDPEASLAEPRFPIGEEAGDGAAPAGAPAELPEYVGDVLPPVASTGSLVLAAIAIALLVGAGARALTLHALGPAPGPQSVERDGVQAVGIESFVLRDAEDRRVLVVRGSLRGRAPQAARVRVAAADAGGEPLGAAVVAHPVRISDAGLDPDTLGRLARGAATVPGPPGFTAVLLEPDPETARVRVEISAATDPRSR